MATTIPDFQIVCIKPTCGATADLDANGFRKVGDTMEPVGAKRPAGWIAGPADPLNIRGGLCPNCAIEWEKAAQEFLTRDIPAPAPMARKFDVLPAKCAPVDQIMIQQVEKSTHAPIEAPKVQGMAAIPVKHETLRPNTIQPTVGIANGGYGASMPAPLPSKPIMQSFKSSGFSIAAPASMQPAKPNMAVQTVSSPLPNRVNCTPDQNGTTAPVFHDYRATEVPGIGAFAGPSGGKEVSYAPFESVKPELLKAP